MESSKESLWGLWKTSSGWDDLSVRQRLIVIWWSLSFFGFCIEGSLVLIILAVANFAAANYCTVKYVPEPKDD